MVVGEDEEADTLHLPSPRRNIFDCDDDAEGVTGFKG